MSYPDLFGQFADAPREFGIDELDPEQLIRLMLRFNGRLLLFNWTNLDELVNRVGARNVGIIKNDSGFPDQPRFVNVREGFGATLEGDTSVYLEFADNYPKFLGANHTFAQLRTFVSGTRYAFDTDSASGGSARMFFGSTSNGPTMITSGGTLDASGLVFSESVSPTGRPDASLFGYVLDADTNIRTIYVDQYKVAEVADYVSPQTIEIEAAGANVCARFSGSNNLSQNERVGLTFHGDEALTGERWVEFVREVFGRPVYSDQPHFADDLPVSYPVTLFHDVPFFDRSGEIVADIGSGGDVGSGGPMDGGEPDVPATPWFLRTMNIESPQTMPLTSRGLDWSNGFTLRFWVRCDLVASRAVCSALQSSGGPGWYCNFSGTFFRFLVTDGTNTADSVISFTVKQYEWYQIAVSWDDGNELRVRIEDELGNVVGTDTVSSSATLPSYTNPLIFNEADGYLSTGWHTYAGAKVFEGAVTLAELQDFTLNPLDLFNAGAVTDLDVIERTKVAHVLPSRATLNSSGEVDTIDDNTPFGQTITGSGAPTLNAAGNRIVFDGDDVVAADTVAPIIALRGRTTGILMACSNAASGPLFTHAGATGSPNLELYLNSSFQIELYFDGTLEATSESVGPDFTVAGAGTRGGDWKLWVNGAVLASGTGGSLSPLDNNIFRIGANYLVGSFPPTFDEGYVGEVAEVLIHNRLYRDSEVSAWHDYAMDEYSLGPLTYFERVQEVLGASNLVGHYKHNEGSGTTANDATGNGNDLTYVNGPSLGADSLIRGGGTSVDFDGSTNYVDAGANTAFDFINQSGGATVSLWADLLSDGTFRTLVSNTDNGGGNGILIRQSNNDQIQVFVNGALLTVEDVLSAGRVHICVTIEEGEDDPGRVVVYLDGDRKVAGDAGPSSSTAADLNIGRFGGSVADQYFDGRIEEVTFASVVASADEVAALYNYGVP